MILHGCNRLYKKKKICFIFQDINWKTMIIGTFFFLPGDLTISTDDKVYFLRLLHLLQKIRNRESLRESGTYFITAMLNGFENDISILHAFRHHRAHDLASNTLQQAHLSGEDQPETPLSPLLASAELILSAPR